jgi:hypothetical protein
MGSLEGEETWRTAPLLNGFENKFLKDGPGGETVCDMCEIRFMMGKWG